MNIINIINIINGNIYMPDFQFHKGSLTLKGDKIQAVRAGSGADTSCFASCFTSCSDNTDTEDSCTIDAGGCYVIPGLIDIHFHGCMGHDFCDGTTDALREIARYEASQGVTGICPASMTLPRQTLFGIMQNAHDYYLLQHSSENNAAGSISEWDCADFLGIYMEGPFLSRAKKGAQNAAFLHKPDITLFQQLQEASGSLIKLVAVAPEEDAGYSFIRQASKSCVVSLAHTAADYNTCREAFRAGASHVTHLFNAMNAFSHREPGLPGAAFDAACSSSCDAELISDGVHVAPAAIRMAFRLFTEKHIILVSDSMMAAGMPDGSYFLGGQPVTVQGSLATLKDGTIAGSATHLTDCMRRAVRFGIPLESAVRCATANPARSIGYDDRYGFLKPGYTANVVILNPDLSLRNVILRGRQLI